MKWVVMITVVPCAASPVMRLQKERLAGTSMPLVGSSRNRMPGRCSRAQAMDSRCL